MRHPDDRVDVFDPRDMVDEQELRDIIVRRREEGIISIFAYGTGITVDDHTATRIANGILNLLQSEQQGDQE